MQSLNVTKLTIEQLEQLTHRLPNYTIVNYDSLRKQSQQIDENYPYSMPTRLIILITVLGILMIGMTITITFYCKYKNKPNHFKTLSLLWHKETLD